MADFAPPPGPPPPQVPEGWKAVWNDQYKEWFYVNTYTKASQWDKPTSPAVGPRPDGGAPGGPPPGYDHSSAHPTGPEKPSYGGNTANLSEDEKYARKLQEEENARAGNTSRGAADSYYGSSGPQAQGPPSYGGQQQPQQGYGQQSHGQPQDLPPRESDKSKGGLFGKLASKLGGSSSSRPPQQQYGGGYQQQQYGGGYQQQQYGGYPPQGYPPQQYGQQPPRKSGGIGMGGAMLGAGAGLVGGALLMDAIDDHDQNEYQEGYQDGQNDDYGGGDDYGGDDGGDF